MIDPLAFLREMLDALDDLPEKVLIADELIQEGAVCAIGSVGKSRGIDMAKLDPEDPDQVAATFGISSALSREIAYVNDEWNRNDTPAERFVRVRAWVVKQLEFPGT